MSVLCWGGTLFLVALLLQLIVWRISLPRRQTKMLLSIFFSTLAIGLFVAHALSSPGNVLAINSFSGYIHISIFFVSLTLAYMITYSAIEADSPSLSMVNSIAKAGPGGLDEQLFIQMMSDDLLVNPRIEDLLRDKMAYQAGNKLRLTTKGLLFARLFILQRKLLDLPKGG